jgi:uncharacterized protein YkwD
LSAPPRPRLRPQVESLDQRRLPTTAGLLGGFLGVVGTNATDVIRIDYLWTPLGRSPVPQGVVVVQGVAAYPMSMVRGIVIQGLGGNDVIGVNDAGRPVLPVWVFGGAGNDIIAAGANTFIDGGPGPNFINGAWDQIPAPPPKPTPILSPLEQQIVNLTNQARQQAGLAPLLISPQLVTAARTHANDMARLDVMEHTLPGVAQPTLEDRARAVGYSYSWLGENIADGFTDAVNLFANWMASDGHRANILSPNYTQIGVAIAYSAQGDPYWCQVFGAPA